MYRQSEATIDLGAIRSNCALARKLAPDSKIIAVIKADAYGHGAVQVARALQSSVEAFAVAMVEEAVQLRDAGIDKPILLLEGVSDRADLEAAIEHQLWFMLHNREQVDFLLSTKTDSIPGVWLKVDTGMHRLGIDPSELGGFLQRIESAKLATGKTVLCTHLASADERASEQTQSQLNAFKAIVADYSLPCSISNSAGILAWPESHTDWNRPGYMLYGNSPFSESCSNADKLKPAMTLSAKLIAVRNIDSGESVGYGATWTATRPSLIGTVAIGYADGYPASATNGTPTVVNGLTAPLVGAVSMDMISIDLTDQVNVSVGDTVVLWGDSLSVNEVAMHAGSTGYELLVRPSLRIPRRYIGQDDSA